MTTDAPAAPRRIQRLPPLVADQIAAGEVVERPASVVKELVENSLDAGATRVRVEIEAGGIELVRVTDDGGGIPAEDLALALEPHATSKVRSTDDLDRIATLGFRGEALASIASVSRLTLRSRTRDDAGAHEVSAEGGVVSLARPAAGPVGTCVSVRNLFWNTPARRKFLRTAQTERERCQAVVEQLALAHPAVAFAFVVDGKSVIDLPAEQSPRERVLGVLGNELADQLVPVSADRFDDARGLSLWGMAGLPSLARGSAKGQQVFVNGRCVRDRTVQHAIAEAYRGIIEPGRFPTVVLMLEMSPEGVDVNVHPQKAEVRFRDSSMVHSVVLRALREALQRADLTPKAGDLRAAAAWSPVTGASRDLMGAWSPAPNGLPAPAPGIVEAKFAAYFARFRPSDHQMPLSLAAGLAETGDAAPEPSATPPARAAAPAEPVVVKPAERILQVHNSYVVTQDEQGVVIIDQHALHERVMFEYLVARVSSGSLERQHLLAPVPVRVPPAQEALVEGLRPLLERIGLEIDVLSPGTLGVRSFPSFLFERGVDPAAFVEDVLRKAESGELTAQGDGFETAIRDVLDMMACKAAVKAGDKLSETELTELVKLRDDVERSSNCPHGRPTSIRLTIRELEKLFGRS
ncbi:MAG TPA: DNA mismatch repair endonuclease MutL [Phycisphaerales bacterium]|nr:DNA mismatch repair endonuclease MutL [Phycisphaerales bacterium]